MNLKMFVFIALLLLTSCGGTPYVPPTSGPSAAVQTTTYPAVGVIKGLKPETPSIDIDHEEIKGLMPAMEMEFHVSDKKLLDGLAVGDRIDFSVEHGVGGLRVVAIKKK
jgi:Cu/Ag efflux protein CusF